MNRHTLPRRFAALLLAGLVCASSTGLALHDPACLHHQAAGGEEPAGVHDAAHDADHHAGSGHEHAPTEEDCQCLGFCALAGQVHATVATGGVQLHLAAAVTTEGEAPHAGLAVPVPAPAIQPPATGPPALS